MVEVGAARKTRKCESGGQVCSPIPVPVSAMVVFELRKTSYHMEVNL